MCIIFMIFLIKCLNVEYFVGFISLLFGLRVYYQIVVNVVDFMQYLEINKYVCFDIWQYNSIVVSNYSDLQMLS